jgi:MFS family permease
MSSSEASLGTKPDLAEARADTIETGASWVIAFAVLFVLTFSYGAPMVVAIALKPIAADLGSTRSVPALASSLVWFGSGLGAIGLGWIATRVGVRATVAFGGAMIGAGLMLSAGGAVWQLILGHGLFIGLLGSGAINVLLMVYVSRWFDRRRGSALALVSSGQYIAGALWPSAIAFGIERAGWRFTMLMVGAVTVLAIVPAALFFLRPAPENGPGPAGGSTTRADAQVLRLSPRMAFTLLSIAGFFCCVPMAMPAAHLVALCSDVGIKPSQSALMLSLMLGCAFLSRQFWGWLSDRVGGLYTILAASTSQALAMSGFLLTQDEAGLFAVSAAFGLGFSGIIPAYVLALRHLFPVEEASWRIPLWYFINLGGMGAGAWLAGYIYDQLGWYGPAFAAGLVLNVLNIALIAWLALRQGRPQPLSA